MNEQKQTIITQKARKELQEVVNDSRYNVSYCHMGAALPQYLLTFCDVVVSYCDTMQGMLESANIHKENRS